MADVAELEASLTQLRAQEAGATGLLQLNPDNDELKQLLASIAEARALTEQSLLALKQAAMLELLDASVRQPLPPSPPRSSSPPPPPLPPVGETVLARYVADGRFYAARIMAVFPPHGVRLRWLFATQRLPPFHLGACAIKPFEGVDLRSLHPGSDCLALRPDRSDDVWSWAKVVSRGGGRGAGGLGVDREDQEQILVEFADESDDDERPTSKALDAAGRQCVVPASNVAPAEYAIELPEDDGASEASGGSDADSDEEEHDEDECQDGATTAAVGGSPGWVGARARGAVGDFENHTRGVGSRLMRAMGYVDGQGLGRQQQGPVHCLTVERLPQRQLSLDNVAAHRAKRQERSAQGLDGGGDATGVKRGGKNRHRGGTGRWRRARRHAGLDPLERHQVARALERGPEPPDVFDFMNSSIGVKRPPTERERREFEVKQAVRDKKKAAPTLRRRLLQVQEKKSALQAEAAQLQQRGQRLAGAAGSAAAGGSNTVSMGQQLVQQDQGRLRHLAREVASLEAEERQLARMLGEKDDKKKLFKF